MQNTIKRIRKGDPEAFIQLIDQESDLLYKTAWSVLHNDSDVADAVQETILICYEKLSALKNPRCFRAWMIRILRNECYRILRERSHFQECEEVPELSAPALADEKQDFQSLLYGLDPVSQQIVTLFYADEFSIREIADLMELNANTVKTRLRRARQKIKEEMEHEEK